MNTLAILKRNLLKLESLEKLTLKELQDKLKNEKYINAVNVFLSRLSMVFNNEMGINKATTKIFLSSYAMAWHCESVTSNDTYAKKLHHNAMDMLMNLETLFTKEQVTLKEYNKYMNSFNRYIEFFQVWRERDSLLLARPSINSWFNIDMTVENFRKKIVQNKSLQIEEINKITEKVRDLNRVKKRLEHNIRIIAGKKGLEFLEKREMPYFKDEEIFKSVEKTVRKAFWDVVKENFKNEKYDQLLVLLTDIKNLITEVTSSKKNELDEVIDIELLAQMINNGMLNDKAINGYINYIIKHIEDMQPPAEDTNTRLWKENISSMIEKEESRSEVLVYFFENAFEKLEKIKLVTLRIREQLKALKK